MRCTMIRRTFLKSAFATAVLLGSSSTTLFAAQSGVRVYVGGPIFLSLIHI